MDNVEMVRYLFSTRRWAELVSAVFCVTYGSWVWFLMAMELGDPLSWAIKDNPDARQLFGALFILAGLIHAIGINVNGRWRWSPILRLIGMVIHTYLCSWLCLASFKILSSGFVPYFFLTMLVAYGATSAAKDTILAIRGVKAWMH